MVVVIIRAWIIMIRQSSNNALYPRGADGKEHEDVVRVDLGVLWAHQPPDCVDGLRVLLFVNRDCFTDVKGLHSSNDVKEKRVVLSGKRAQIHFFRRRGGGG